VEEDLEAKVRREKSRNFKVAKQNNRKSKITRNENTEGTLRIEYKAERVRKMGTKSI
jgi:hypothetical protein